MDFSFDEKISTPLCEIMGRNRSDKGHKDITKSWHNYTTFYYSIFNELRDKTLRIFELGLGTNNTNIPSNMGENGRPGASLYGWREFFHNSDIFGADIDAGILFNTDKIKTFYCDQTNPQIIQKMWNETDLQENFDIIIEDGLHTFSANVCFFENSIHKLKPNGYFIIEDILKVEESLFVRKIKEWELQYHDCQFTLLKIPSLCNNCDNILVVVYKTSDHIYKPPKHDKTSNRDKTPSHSESVEILMVVGSNACQHRSNLKKINDFYAKLTNKKWFDIELFDDFCDAFKTCNSIGLCTILTQFVTNCYYLFESNSQIMKHRKYYEQMIKFMIANTGPIYENINSLNTFINRNNAYPYAYHDISNASLFQNIARLQYGLCPDLLLNTVKVRPVDDNDNNSTKIKVGFVSDFIITFHSVAKDRLGIIKHLCDDPEFDVKIMTRKKNTHLFYDKIMADANPSTLENLIVTMEEEDLAANRKQIADQNFDIIVYPEIGMCQQTRFLAFSRLAPVQISTWGHSDTSGLPNIDYFVSSKFFNTEDDQAHYSEKMVLFDSLGTYYYDIFNYFKDEIQLETDKTDADAFRQDVIEKTGVENPNIYGCIQIFIKMNPSFAYMLNEILKADENGVIVLLSTNKGEEDDIMFTNYIKMKLAAYLDRVYFIYQAPFVQYATNLKNCDLILDYFPFGGLNSIIESFLLGKVCITCPGNRISGKFTQGLYHKMGITEFICDTKKEYVAKAVKYGKNHDERKEYETRILNNVHKIIEEKESVDEWKTFLKNSYNAIKIQ